MVHFLGNYSQSLFFLFCYSVKDDILDLPVNFFKFYDNDLGILCQVIMSASSVLKILLHSYISFFLVFAKGLGNMSFCEHVHLHDIFGCILFICMF